MAHKKFYDNFDVFNTTKTNERIGKTYENTMTYAAIQLNNTELDHDKPNTYLKTTNFVGTAEDQLHGTDATMTFFENAKNGGLKPFKMRVDWTLNMSSKDNMPFIYETRIPVSNTGNFYTIGIREANDYRKNGRKAGVFKTVTPDPDSPNGVRTDPSSDFVVVVGTNMTSEEFKRNSDAIEDDAQRDLKKLLPYMKEAYFDYTYNKDELRKHYLKLSNGKGVLKNNPYYVESESMTDSNPSIPVSALPEKAQTRHINAKNRIAAAADAAAAQKARKEKVQNEHNAENKSFE